MGRFLFPWVVGLPLLLLGPWGCGRIHFESPYRDSGDRGGMDAGLEAGKGALDAADAAYVWDGGSRPDVSSTRDASSMWDASPDGSSTRDASSVTDATYTPDASDATTGDTGSGCAVASDTCWDVWAVHTKTKFERVANHVFEKEVSDGETVYGLFDGSSDTPQPLDNIDCPPYYLNQDKPKGWEIWRTAIDANTYRIQVSGISDADCMKGQPVAAGEIQIDTDRWQIATVDRCDVKEDTLDSNDTLIDTWCTVDMGAGNVSWQSGSGCGGCCDCPDGARVEIDFTVESK